jgi:hypothetical protein
VAYHVVRALLRMAAPGRSRHKEYLGGPAFCGVALYLVAMRTTLFDERRKLHEAWATFVTGSRN